MHMLLLVVLLAQPEIVGVAARGRAVDAHMIGYNSDFYQIDEPWADADRRGAAVAARPGRLRYPGGTSANYWDAQRSRMFRDVESLDTRDGDPAAWIRTRYTIQWIANAFFWRNVNSLADLSRLRLALAESDPAGADVVFVANMVTPGPDFYEQKWNRPLDHAPGSDDWWAMMGARRGAFEGMLTAAAQQGIPVRCVELGNEFYFGAGLTHDGKPADVEPYVASAFDADRHFTLEPVGAFPDLGRDDAPALFHYGVAANDWAGRIKAAHPEARVCAVAAFLDTGDRADRMKAWNRAALSALDPTRVDALALHLYGGPRAGSLTGTEAELGAALKSWTDFWIAGRDRSGLPTRFEWWITEFNIDDEFGDGDALPDSKHAWGNGLGNVHCVLHWLEHEPNVKIALLHELARVIDGDGPGIHANGRAYGLLARAANGRTRARRVEIKNAPRLDGSDASIDGLVGWCFDAPDAAPRHLIVNRTGREQTLSGVAHLPGFDRAGTIVQASAPLDQTRDPGETVDRRSADRPTETLTLPPYSVTVVD